MTDGLKLFDECGAATLAPERGPPAPAALGEAFAAATGWRYEGPTTDWDGTRSDVPLSISPEANARCERAAALRLAESIQRATFELERTQLELSEREAELAALTSAAPQAARRGQIAERLTRAMKQAARAIGCGAVAAYLLDDDTTQLRLRCAWRLPRARFLAPARPLEGATAEIEALAGNVIALENAELMELWRAPEPFAAGLCVPLARANELLGTLWLYGRTARKFSPRQIAVARLLAGCLVAEWERGALLAESQSLAGLRDQLTEISSDVGGAHSPSLDSEPWAISGWDRSESAIAAAFHVSRAVDGGEHWAAVGECNGRRLAAAWRASTLRAILQARWENAHAPSGLLSDVNRQFYASHAGNGMATLVVTRMTGDDKLRLCVAGDPCVVMVSRLGASALTAVEAPLGMSAAFAPREFRLRLPRGAALILATSGVRDALNSRGRTWGVRGLVRAARGMTGATSAVLADVIRDRLEAHAADERLTDCALAVIARRR